MNITRVKIEQLLKKAIGLDADAIGRSTVARAVAERQHASGAHDPDEYWQQLSASPTELGLLIESVVVPETWFFRYPEAFAALTRLVQDDHRRAHPDGTLRLLSVPCSTGEEPCSMAMALIDTGVPPEGFRIDAIDVSPRALSTARTGLYGKNSFRGADLSFRSRHFTATPSGYELSDRVRARVCFAQGNLLAPHAPGERYDVVFCRNLLIYFDRPTQERAVAEVARLLTPGGLLFVGPSETAVVAGREFVSAGLPMAFAFRKEIVAPREDAVAARPPRPSLSRSPIARPAAALKRAPPAPAAPPTGPSPVTTPRAAGRRGIEAALDLADQGHFAEAARCCEEHVRRHGPSAQAFYLLGMVRDASGLAREAGQSYRKALYLDPHHADALMHLALLVEQQGDRSEAQVLRNRLRRLEPQGEA